jgi:hypothetical protein
VSPAEELRVIALSRAVTFVTEAMGSERVEIKDDIADLIVSTANKFANFLAGDSKEDADGWVDWNGSTKECPLPNGTPHEVRFRAGTTSRDDSPETWSWRHEGSPNDIVAYRVAEGGDA